MATTKKTPMAVNDADERTAGMSADPAATEGTEQPQVTTDVADLGDPRTGAPTPPTGLIGMSSRDTVARITILLQGAQMQSRQHPDAWQAAANAVTVVSTAHLHPQVASYKAEALDYLRGKIAQVSAQ